MPEACWGYIYGMCFHPIAVACVQDNQRNRSDKVFEGDTNGGKCSRYYIQYTTSIVRWHTVMLKNWNGSQSRVVPYSVPGYKFKTKQNPFTICNAFWILCRMQTDPNQKYTQVELCPYIQFAEHDMFYNNCCNHI